jgi:hypothetical protein
MSEAMLKYRFRYTCKTCGYVRYGDHTQRGIYCDSCHSAYFGQWRSERLSLDDIAKLQQRIDEAGQP